MIKFFILLCLTILSTVALVSCGESGVDALESAVIEQDGKIFIRDRTGKLWDVTHAKSRYGLEPSKFQFGLGPNAIRPILDPVLLSEGDNGYPNDNETVLVIGTDLNDEPRAYSIPALSRVEIVDEIFGDAHVAVAY